MSKSIPLTQGFVAIVDDENFAELNQHRWYAHRQDHRVYARRKAKKSEGVRRHFEMHQVIMQAKGIDHWDGDGLNNQRSNLRIATDSQNQANRRMTKSNRSGRRGVSRSGSRWIAMIYKNRKQIVLGRFDDLDDAARAYDRAARELFGEFARPNFEEIAS